MHIMADVALAQWQYYLVQAIGAGWLPRGGR